MYQLYFLIETKKSLYIYSLPYNINIKYNFCFAFRDFFNDYEETKKKKKKEKMKSIIPTGLVLFQLTKQ